MGGEHVTRADNRSGLRWENAKSCSVIVRNRSLSLALLRLLLVGLSTLFMFPVVGCRQEVNNSSIQFQSNTITLLIHPSSNPTTRANLDLPTPRKTSISFMSQAQVGKYSNSEFESESEILEKSEFPSNTENPDDPPDENIHKLLRQIVPLPPPKKSSGTDAQLMTLYVGFIADFAIHNGWSVVRILLPESTATKKEELCEYFTKTLARSKAALKTRCGSEMGITTPTMNNVNVNGPEKTDSSSSSGLIMPIFSFHFLSGKNKTASRGVPLHPKFLINYLPKRPVFVFGGGEENRELIIDQIQPEIQTNYKWTLISVSNRSNDTLILEDVYGFTTGEPLTQTFGSWTAQMGVQIDTEKALGLSDFQGRMLRVTTVAGHPFVFLDKSKEKLRSYGYLPDILDIISFGLNFTYKIMTPADSQFGNEGTNGSWTGMVGMLQRKEAEIALMSFSLTASRKKVMDFSPPVEYSSVRLLIRRDWQNAELKWSAYLQPLGSNVWIAIPIFIVLGVITLAIFSKTKVLEITPFNSAWLLTSCFVLQGQDEHSVIKVTPYRLVLGTFWVLSVVIFACYTARLTSFLAANTETLPINSLAQAVKNRNWKVGLVKGSAFIDRIRESRVDVLRGLYQRINEDSSSLVDTFQDGMDKVFKERYIFFTSELIPTFLIRGNCSYTWLPTDKYFPGFGYVGYQKYLPFAPIISQRVAEVRQSGQMKRLFQKWWGAESVCNTKSGDSFLGMSLYETGTAFLILLFGISLSITLMVGELFSRARYNFRHGSSAVVARDTDNVIMPMGSSGTLGSEFSNNFGQHSNKTNNLSFWN